MYHILTLFFDIEHYYKNIETQEMKEKKNLIVANKILKTPKSERKPTKKNRRELISFLENKN